MIVHTILYVNDQKISRDFYKSVLNVAPKLDVPGMTEFQLSESHILGLMPENGIKRLLGRSIADFNSTIVTPRAELYFRVENPTDYFSRAIELGGKELSPILKRDWGDEAGYIMDRDGYILAFAKALVSDE
ncbi:MAG: hypothetical protein KDD45_00435 [Bdellovibrionales bacterium]|nr:hypothetical protein [Bdellovibrionales bacterium]